MCFFFLMQSDYDFEPGRLFGFFILENTIFMVLLPVVVWPIFVLSITTKTIAMKNFKIKEGVTKEEFAGCIRKIWHLKQIDLASLPQEEIRNLVSNPSVENL